MAGLITKYLLTAAVVVLISEAAKRSDRPGAFALVVRHFGIQLLP